MAFLNVPHLSKGNFAKIPSFLHISCDTPPKTNGWNPRIAGFSIDVSPLSVWVYFAGFSSGSFQGWTIGPIMTGAGNASMPSPSGDMPRLEPSEGWVGMGMVLPFLPESWFSGK